MKVFSVVDNPGLEKNHKHTKGKVNNKKKAPRPSRKAMTAAQIREKVAARAEKNNALKMSHKEKMKHFEASKLPDLDDAEKRIVGDVGKNDPNDLATHGKLKKIISMNGFDFSEKERRTLEKILQA